MATPKSADHTEVSPVQMVVIQRCPLPRTTGIKPYSLQVEQRSPLPPGMNLNFAVLKLTQIPLAGQLKHYIANWKQISKDHWVLQAVQVCQLEFIAILHQEYIPTPHYFSQEEISLVQKEVHELLQT